MSLEEIAEYEKLEGADINKGKEKLAYELTKLIHGAEEADKALEAAKSVFGAGNMSENMPTTELGADAFADGAISVIDMLVVSKLAPSKGEARRLIQQGGISVDDEKVTDFGATVSAEKFADGVVVKKGKKVFHRFVIAK
jgi:tyrosyl-tRNA synthetase